MSVPASLPILVFDGDCGFCTTSARLLVRWVLRGRPTSAERPAEPLVEPWQRLDLAELGLTADQCRSAVQWVDQAGQVASGHEAVAAVLRAGHPVWRPIGALLTAPGFGWLAGRLYSWISDHRYALPGGTPACRPEGPEGPDCTDGPGVAG
jgi:predicted DCC family thiol-disulfide oxidoreductase YuxK